MKRRKITLLLVLLCSVSFSADAQISARIAALRSRINSQITTATGFRSVTAANHGNILDSMLAIANDMAAADLQVVLDEGNSAVDQLISMTKTGATDRTLIAPEAISLRGDPSIYTAQLRADGSMSASRVFYLPNYSTGNATADAVVTHVTGAQINILDPSVSPIGQAVLKFSGIELVGTPYPTTLAELKINSNAPQLVLGDPGAIHAFMEDDALTFANSVSIYAKLDVSTGGGELSLRDASLGGGSIAKIMCNGNVAAPVVHYLSQYGGVGKDLVNKFTGSVSTAPGGTTLVFAHGLPFTPRMILTPTNAAAAAWLSNAFVTSTGTNTTITGAAPAVGTVTFDWFALP